MEDGAVVRIAVLAVVIAQQRRDALFDEQVFVHQPLLLDEPDEQQPRDEPDDVFFGLQRNGFARGESRFLDGALKPREKVFVELLVELFGIERGEPGFKQPVEVFGLAARLHPLQPFIERQLGENIEMGAVGVVRNNLADERDAADDVPVRVPPVGAAVNEGESQPPVGRAEQDGAGHGEGFVDLAREGGAAPARVSRAVQVDGGEQEAARVAVLESPGRVEQRHLGAPADFAVGYLEHDAHGGGAREKVALGLGVGGSGQPEGGVVGLVGRRQVAFVAERVQQTLGGVREPRRGGRIGERPLDAVSDFGGFYHVRWRLAAGWLVVREPSQPSEIKSESRPADPLSLYGRGLG